jgi:TonB-linked SusC/RagA family outer membrane protein
MPVIRNKYKLLFLLFVAIFAGMNIIKAQDAEYYTVEGSVTSLAGDPLGGVAVSIPEDFKYAVTDEEGNFSIEALVGANIVFTKDGFLSVSKKVEFGVRNLEIILEPVANYNQIAVAYGYRNKNELTHAVSSIGRGSLERNPVANLSNAIVGRTTGITVLKNGGDEPGYDNSSIFVRGIGTFSSARSPLVLVDHIERDFTQLDAMEIESFSVLKDAAATVQYGIRGANGVVSVQTKRGFVGKPEINFVSQAGFALPSRLPDYLGAAEYVEFYNKALTNDGLPLPTDSRYDPAMYDGTNDPFLFPDVDWYGEFLKDYSSQQQHKLSVRGGTQSVRYFLFMGITQQNGIYEFADINPQYSTNSNFTRYNLRSNIDVDVTESLEVAIDISTRVENRHVPNSSAGAIFGTLSQLPPNAMPVKNRDGSLAGTSIYRNNPLGMISRTGYRDNYNRILFGNAEATQKLDNILKGLSANVLIGLDGTNYYSLGRGQQYAVYQEYMQNDSVLYAQYGENSDISLDIQKFDDGFSYMVTSIGGLEYYNEFGSSTLGGDLKYMQSKFFLHGNNIAYANQGVFGRMTYGFRNTYFAEVGFSYNGSENFAPGNRFGFFPAVSAAWVVSNEDFIPDNISYLKLRSSVGKSGNSQLGLERFPFEERYYSGWGYTFGTGYTSTTGSYEGRLPNPGLQWEEATIANIGIDLELYNNFSLSFDLFNESRDKIITTGTNTIPSILGQSPPYQNNGSVLNQGFEATLGYKKSQSNLSYSLYGNISYAKNQIKNMDEVDGLLDYQYMKGKSVTAIWGLETLGYFSSQEDIANSPQQSFDAVKPGDLKFKDQNGDNIIDAQDRVVIGDAIPAWSFGLLGSVRYKSFDVHWVVTGIMGRTVMLTNNSMWILQGNNKVTDLAYGAWEAGINEENATYPRLTTLSNQNNYNNSDFWAHSGDFLRLTNMEIGYYLPKSLLSRVGIGEIRFFLNASNLLTLDYTGKFNLDPEVPNAGVSGYPVMRVFNTGISIQF